MEAAHSLLGLTLRTGWRVTKKIDKAENQTGSTFSVGYYAEKNGEVCFLKAYDFSMFLSMATPKPGETEVDVMDAINDMTTAFRYERDLSKHCQDKHVTKVAFVKESGQEIVPGFSITLVPYLVFDLAEGDVRKRLEYNQKIDYAWRLKSLRDIAVGLRQLHIIEVSHQDLKPSNILVFKRESKIGDLGRSMCLALDGPYNKLTFAGDWNYAPPEMMYRYFEKDWLRRVCATDCYLLGSLLVFYFTGVSMTALLRSKIPDAFSWENWRGPFDEIKSYLETGFSDALEEFEININEVQFKAPLKELVKYLCHPFPDKRGHPKRLHFQKNPYDFERIITRLDVLRRKAEISLIN